MIPLFGALTSRDGNPLRHYKSSGVSGESVGWWEEGFSSQTRWEEVGAWIGRRKRVDTADGGGHFCKGTEAGRGIAHHWTQEETAWWG